MWNNDFKLLKYERRGRGGRHFRSPWLLNIFIKVRKMVWKCSLVIILKQKTVMFTCDFHSYIHCHRKRWCICIPKFSRSIVLGGLETKCESAPQRAWPLALHEPANKLKTLTEGNRMVSWIFLSFSSKTFLSLIFGCHKTLCKDLRYSFESSLFNFSHKVGCILALLLCHCIWYWHRGFFQQERRVFFYAFVPFNESLSFSYALGIFSI